MAIAAKFVAQVGLHAGELSVVAIVARWVWMARGTKIVCVVGLHDDADCD